MPGVEHRDFTSPDETRTPERTTVEIVKIDGGEDNSLRFARGAHLCEVLAGVIARPGQRARCDLEETLGPGNRAPAYSSAFYNTQGRQRSVYADQAWQYSGKLYISADDLGTGENVTFRRLGLQDRMVEQACELVAGHGGLLPGLPRARSMRCATRWTPARSMAACFSACRA